VERTVPSSPDSVDVSKLVIHLHNKQDGQCTHNVTLSRVHVTIVVVETQKCIT
jgi:hypothetical protein